jgi:hypothetical protein
MSVLSLLAAVDSGSSYSSGNAGAALAGLGMILVISLVVYLIAGFLMYRIFEKAGRPGWAGFVPIYNGWVLFEISGKPGWWILFALIPYLGGLVLVVLTLLASLELAKRFGKSTLFGVVGLWLFSLVGYAILAFDSSKYNASGAQSSASVNSNSTPSQTPSGLVQ